MANWEPERVTFSRSAYAGATFISVCCLAVAWILWRYGV
jgi:hypothetical protein